MHELIFVNSATPIFEDIGQLNGWRPRDIIKKHWGCTWQLRPLKTDIGNYHVFKGMSEMSLIWNSPNTIF